MIPLCIHGIRRDWFTAPRDDRLLIAVRNICELETEKTKKEDSVKSEMVKGHPSATLFSEPQNFTLWFNP